MKKFICLFSIFLCAVLLTPAAAHSASLQLSKGLPHYMREIEYYYQKPRPVIIPELLPVLVRNGALAKSENRLMLAAFLAELHRKDAVDLIPLVDSATGLNRDARHTMAWSVHLAGYPNEKELLAKLLAPSEGYLSAQIQRSPARLSSWDLQKEKSVQQMFWAAFMASGNTDWIDRIIGQALKYARSGDPGRHPDANFATGSAAAASLYDFAPRHSLVVERIKKFLPGKKGGEEKMLNLILGHAKN